MLRFGERKSASMQEPSRSGFSHRHNRDGSFDTICICCFSTVHSADAESELSSAELSHECWRARSLSQQSARLQILGRLR
jgi:hypothetical protein